MSYWLEEEVVYEGWGRADFLSPIGFIEGTTKIVFSSEAEPSCIMKVERSEPSTKFGLLLLLSGEKPIQTPEGETLYISGRSNPCSSLVVKCGDGIFSTDKVSYSHETSLGNRTVSMGIWEGRYDRNIAGKPRFFAIPLLNYLTKYYQGKRTSFEHPLRFFHVSDMKGDDDCRRRLLFNMADMTVPYHFKKGVAFIDPVPNYDETCQSIQNREKRRKITGVLIGDCSSLPDNTKAIYDYFTPRFRSLLALGTGQLVAAPWIEFRTEDNLLVSRIHHPAGNAHYEPIRAPVPGCLGRLVYVGMGAIIEHEEAWNVACLHAARAGRENAALEENIHYSIQGLETLSAAFGLSHCNLLDEVSAEHKESVKNILNEAARNIKILKESGCERNSVSEVAIGKISDRALTACQTDLSFPVAISKLIEKFQLPDLEMISQVPLSKPWDQLLGYVRGQIVHQGYLKIESNENFSEYVALSNHLRDILVRILFKMVGFEGNYKPLTLYGPYEEPVDFLKNKFALKGNKAIAYLGYPSCPESEGTYGKITISEGEPPKS
jgi:hypothetical protein